MCFDVAARYLLIADPLQCGFSTRRRLIAGHIADLDATRTTARDRTGQKRQRIFGQAEFPPALGAPFEHKADIHVPVSNDVHLNTRENGGSVSDACAPASAADGAFSSSKNALQNMDFIFTISQRVTSVDSLASRKNSSRSENMLSEKATFLAGVPPTGAMRTVFGHQRP